MSKTKDRRRAAQARKSAAATTAMTNARYAVYTRVDVWGGHPALVRLADGLMVPCTHSPARRGEPACPMSYDWADMGDTRKAWAKPLAADRYARLAGCRVTAVNRSDVVAAADAAFAHVR